MLTRLTNTLARHKQAATTSLRLLYRTPLATLMTITVIAMTITLPTLFWVLSDNLKTFTADWQRNGHISLYLTSTLNETAQTALLHKVSQTSGVAKATLKTAAEGLSELRQQEGLEDIMQYLPENPLPAIIDVLPALDIDTPAKVEALYVQLKAYSGVDQAKLDMQWVSRLYAILGVITTLTNGLTFLLALAVILIVGNTLRLAVHNRYEEIQILKLIGATDAFIARPFLYSGIWYAFAGALLAMLFTTVFMLSIFWATNRLITLYHIHYTWIGITGYQASLVVLMATTLGWLGAYLSVKRQLSLY